MSKSELASSSPSISVRNSITLQDSFGDAPTPAKTDAPKKGASAPGKGALKDQQVAVGSGEQRSKGTSAAESFKSGLKKFGMGMFRGLQGVWATAALPLGLVSGLALGVAQLGKMIGAKITGVSADERYARREAKAEQRFIAANQDMVAALKKPQGGPAQSLAAREEVVDRLFQHAQLNGKKLSRDEIRDLVATGENITKAIQGTTGDKLSLPVKVSIDGKSHDVSSNTYTARAVSWFMMAQAAQQDVQRHAKGDTSTSDMTTSGSFVMKDPGNKMYDFLNSAPTAAARMSTHFSERVGHSTEHRVWGFIPTFGLKPAQRGIEDYQGRMPGQSGTMVFDMLKPGQDGTPELFVKFESAGCPPFFSSEKHHNVGDRFLRFFASLDRNAHHAANLVKSVFVKSEKKVGEGGPTTVSRQEHVKKGPLNPSVYEPVKDLVREAVKTGVLKKDDVSGLVKSIEKYGIAPALSLVAAVMAAASHKGNDALLAKATTLASTIDAELKRMGLASDQHGIERRGAEVHIDLAIPPLAPGQATGAPALPPTGPSGAIADDGGDDEEVPLQLNRGKKNLPSVSVPDGKQEVNAPVPSPSAQPHGPVPIEPVDAEADGQSRQVAPSP